MHVKPRFQTMVKRLNKEGCAMRAHDVFSVPLIIFIYRVAGCVIVKRLQLV